MKNASSNKRTSKDISNMNVTYSIDPAAIDKIITDQFKAMHEAYTRIQGRKKVTPHAKILP